MTMTRQKLIKLYAFIFNTMEEIVSNTMEQLFTPYAKKAVFWYQ